MKRSKKLLSLLMATLLLFSLAAGCNKPTDSNAGKGTEGTMGDKPQDKGTPKDSVKIAVYSDFSTFDPYNSGMTLDKVVYGNVFDTLLRYYNGSFENVLCDKYEISDDGTAYTFYLKEGVKFHNGETLKASDVVFSMNRAKESSQMSNYTKAIISTEALDDLTVKITLNAPYVPFLNAVGANVCIMNEKAVTEAGDKVGTMPIGTGPYTYVKWDAGSQVVLERFDGFHGKAAAIKSATYVVLTNPETALIATQTGEVDLTYTIPAIAVADIQKDASLKLDLNPTLGSGYIVLNTEAKFLSDPNFRMALAYATNRDEIVEVGMDGVAKKSSLLWDERTVGFSGKYSLPDYNMDKAKEYLAKTDYKGEQLSFKVGYENYKKIGVVYQEQLKKIGVNISVELLEANTWVTDMKAGNYDMSTVVMTQDPDVDLWSNVLHSNAIGGYNFSRLNNPGVDKAFDEGASMLDEKQRAETYSAIEKELYENVILIPIYNRVVTCCYSKDLVVDRAFDNGFSEVQDMHWN